MEMTSIYVVKVLTNYFEQDEKFKIVKMNNGRVGAINTKYIDASGKLNIELRGCDMFMSDNVAECIERVHTDFVKKDYIAQGFDEWASIVLAHGGTMEKAMECSRLMNEMYAQA